MGVLNSRKFKQATEYRQATGWYLPKYSSALCLECQYKRSSNHRELAKPPHIIGDHSLFIARGLSEVTQKRPELKRKAMGPIK